MSNLPALTGSPPPAPGGGASPLPVPSMPGGVHTHADSDDAALALLRDGQYRAALDLRYTDPRRYNSAEHQALLMQLVQQQIEAPAAGVIADMERELGPAFSMLAESFSALPARAIAGVEAELLEPLVSSRRASEATLEKWRKDPPSKALLEEWGRDGPRLAARVSERIQRLFYRVDSASWDALERWYNSLDGDAAVATIRALSR